MGIWNTVKFQRKCESHTASPPSKGGEHTWNTPLWLASVFHSALRIVVVNQCFECFHQEHIFFLHFKIYRILQRLLPCNERPTATATAAWRLKRLLCVASPLLGVRGCTPARRTAAGTPACRGSRRRSPAALHRCRKGHRCVAAAAAAVVRDVPATGGPGPHPGTPYSRSHANVQWRPPRTKH